MLTRRYNLINNAGGWLVFVIALATYWLTLEPTASYWDCGEFIIQADKLEVGHPPGNPIFMLTARFFANFAPGSEYVPLMVNAMSGLLSALTIMLLFWTISHLVRRLVVKDGQKDEPSLQQMLAIMGSALVGSLAYCWSDTFWFSAVEGEVYAFSSFCTALVFWLILKWENRADEPHSDRYLVLIAYVIGVSVAVHLLNLLCIPAIVLVYAYRRVPGMNLAKSLGALLVSFVIIFLVLFGLVPGFIKVAQQFELLFVNSFGMSFNTGALIYAALFTAMLVWAIYTLWTQRSARMIVASFTAVLLLSGIFYFGSTPLISIVCCAAVAALLLTLLRGRIPVRVLSLVVWSIGVIFVGYSSYALILIRSTADTPMNQNSPDNVFDLASYLNREQYGENPLLYGETLNSAPMKEVTDQRTDTIDIYEGTPIVITTPYYQAIVEKGKPLYAKGVAGAEPTSEYGFLTQGDIARNMELSRRGGDYYVLRDYKAEAKLNPELNMLLPRIYSRQHTDAYRQWVNLDTLPDNLVELHALDKYSGEKVYELNTQAEPDYNPNTGVLSYPVKRAYKPTFAQNLAYFFNYQLNHMYMRYFMWNFAGRQNDINNQFGELDAGNWISGIPVIDTPRLGDQSLLPEELGKGNKGHNVYYMLPLILGLLGLLWQAFAGKRGIEQFWVVFFLFFMTGIAIVLYLNQTPNQPRERDYAFAGSFYAYAIWIGMGVAALWRILLSFKGSKLLKRKPGSEEPEQLESLTDEPAALGKMSRICAAVACVLGLCVPLQMVSQTWDDHDRSGRYAARDYAINYLESLEPNAIVFCNGDNDTFPLWYVQEVEGVRPDVRIINLSYLNSDWYANQMRMQSYESAPVNFTAKPSDYAYGRADVTLLDPDNNTPMPLIDALRQLYAGHGREKYGYPTLPTSVVTIPIDAKTALERGLIAPGDEAMVEGPITVDLSNTPAYRSKGYLSLGEILMLDLIATNAAEGWKRPIYWCSTVGNDYHVGLTPYLRSTGMTHQLVPTVQSEMEARTDRAYKVVTEKYRWGGADAEGKKPYFDETASRMLTSVRSSMLDVAAQLVYDGDRKKDEGNLKGAADDWRKSLRTVRLMEQKLPSETRPYGISGELTRAQIYCELGLKDRLNDPKLTAAGLRILEETMKRYTGHLVYNRAMALRFGQPAFTLETQYIPYQYYRLIELYEQFGGKSEKVDAILKPHGINRQELQKNMDRLYGGGAAEDVAGAAPSADEINGYATEIMKYAEIVNHLAGLSAEEYAASTEDERLIDSTFLDMVDYYLAAGGSEDKLKSSEQYRNVDRARSSRLQEAFAKSHPEFAY